MVNQEKQILQDQGNNDFYARVSKLVNQVKTLRKSQSQKNHPDIDLTLREVLDIIHQTRPTIEDIRRRAKEVRPYNQALNEWKQTESGAYRIKEEQHQKEKQRLQRRIQALESIVIEEHLPTVIQLGLKTGKLPDIPYAYFGLNTYNLIGTNAAKELFGAEKTEETIHLSKLFSYLKKENQRGENVRRKFIDALKKQEHIKNQLAETRDGKTVYLSTYPYYFSPEEHRVVGIGVSFELEHPTSPVLNSQLGQIHRAIEKCIAKVYQKIQKQT